MTQPDPNSAPAVGLAAAFGGPQDSPAQNILPNAPPSSLAKVVAHDVRPHLGQAAEYGRIAAKLREYPSDHPAVASAVDALSSAEFYNDRRAKGVSHEWPAAHAEVVRTLEVVAATFPGASSAAASAPPASPVARAVQAAPQPQPQSEAPSLLWFGHPNYLEALRFVFRGRYVPGSEAGLPLAHVLAYTTKGRMVDTRLRADDPPRMEDEQKHVLAMLEFLVRQDYLEMNDVGGAQMLRLSKSATDQIRYYPYPEAPAVVEEAPRLQLMLVEDPPQTETITTAEPQPSATIVP